MRKLQVLMAQESEAKESFEQLEMLQRTHDKLRSKADQLEAVHDKLFSNLEIVKKTLLVSAKKFMTSQTSTPGLFRIFNSSCSEEDKH